MPKGKLFPVRKAFVSRFEGGELLEVDYSQLEFRVAGILAKDERIKQEVREGFDVHAYTAKVLTDNGEPTERGAAKASTSAKPSRAKSRTQATPVNRSRTGTPSALCNRSPVPPSWKFCVALGRRDGTI